MTKGPDRLNIDKADRELYDHDAVKGEIFAGRANKEQFLFAMAMGFKNQVKRPLDSKEGFVRAEYLRAEDEMLLDIIAVHDEDVDVLSDREKVFRIAEEYAHAGIRLLFDKATSGQPGSFYKKLEVDLFHIFEDLESH